MNEHTPGAADDEGARAQNPATDELPVQRLPDGGAGAGQQPVFRAPGAPDPDQAPATRAGAGRPAEVPVQQVPDQQPRRDAGPAGAQPSVPVQHTPDRPVAERPDLPVGQQPPGDHDSTGHDTGQTTGHDTGQHAEPGAKHALGQHDPVPSAGLDTQHDPQPDPAPGAVPGAQHGSAPGGGDDGDDVPGALVEARHAEQLRTRWREVQSQFVDDPRTAVQGADGLVGEVIEALSRTFAEQRQRVVGRWRDGDDVQTEELRQALRRYRTLFNRLLDL